MGPLLDNAIDSGLLRGIPLPERPSKDFVPDEFIRPDPRTQAEKERDYARILRESFRTLRNGFAHPHSNTLFMPGQGYRILKKSIDIVNCIFRNAPIEIPVGGRGRGKRVG